MKNTILLRCANHRRQVAHVTELCTVVSNLCGLSVECASCSPQILQKRVYVLW